MNTQNKKALRHKKMHLGATRAQYPLGSPSPTAAAVPKRMRCAHKANVPPCPHPLLQKTFVSTDTPFKRISKGRTWVNLRYLQTDERHRQCTHRLRMT